MTVLWGEDYEADCRQLGGDTHQLLGPARNELANKPYAGRVVIEGTDYRALEVREALGLFHVEVAYTIERPYVILWGVLKV